MINLIKNEFIKIFKKKSTYIILIITLAFIVLINFINNNFSNFDYSSIAYDEYSLEQCEETIKSYSPDNPEEVYTYIDIKTHIDIIKLIQKYGFNSWQAYVIQNELENSNENPIYTINSYTYIKGSVTKDMYLKAQKYYNNIIEKLDSNDWKSFVLSDLKDIEIQIENCKNSSTSDNTQIDILNIQKQILEWRLDKNISFENSFLNNCLNQYESSSHYISQYEKNTNHSYEDKLEYFSSLKTKYVSKYYIENNINNVTEFDNRATLINLFDVYSFFILIFVIMIAGGIVSDEFNKGTIKLLLIRPYNRVKIILSKFIVCILLLFIFIIFLATSQFIIGGIICGFDSTSVPVIVYNFNTNQVESLSIIGYVLIQTLAQLPIYILLTTLAFSFSTIFINTSVSIALPFLGYSVSYIINQLALTYNIKFLNYFVTPNWNLTPYLFGGISEFEGLTLPFSLTICFIYFIIMLITSIIVFKKRNIKND